MFYEILHNNFWTQADLSEILDENLYVFKLNNELIKVQEDNIRVVQHTSKTSFTSINENNFVEYEHSKGKWIHSKINNKQGRFLSLNFEINNSIVTALARENQIRNCESTHLKQMYGNLYIEIPKTMNSWEVPENFDEVMTKIIEQIPKKVFFCCFKKNNSDYIRYFGDKEALKSAKILTDLSINNELKIIKIDESKSKMKHEIQLFESEIRKVKRVYIDKDLTRLLIGRRGSNINHIMSKFNVEIKVEKGADKDIIIIQGQNESNITQCSREVSLVIKKYIVKIGMENQLRGYNNSNIYTLINKHYLYNLFLEKEWSENNQSYYTLNIIGTEDTIYDLINEIAFYLEL